MNRRDTFQPKHYATILRDPDGILRDLQAALCSFTGKSRCVLCSSGSAALYMALRAHRPGTLAIPASTFSAIHEACTLCGVGTEIIDTDPETWQSDMARIDTDQETWQSGMACIDVMTSPVHNYGCVDDAGQSCWQSRIVDAAAALLTPGAFDGDGTLCVSFNWNKTISGGGGGALLTDDDDIANLCEGLKRHRGHGAFNFQMPAPCAGEVYSQLADADARVRHLRDLSAAYDCELASRGFGAYPRGNTRWLTGTMLRDTASVESAMQRLAAMGYATRRAWMPLGDQVACPGAWAIYERGLILPGGYEVTVENVKEICGTLDVLR